MTSKASKIIAVVNVNTQQLKRVVREDRAGKPFQIKELSAYLLDNCMIEGKPGAQLGRVYFEEALDYGLGLEVNRLINMFREAKKVLNAEIEIRANGDIYWRGKPGLIALSVEGVQRGTLV